MPKVDICLAFWKTRKKVLGICSALSSCGPLVALEVSVAAKFWPEH